MHISPPGRIGIYLIVTGTVLEASPEIDYKDAVSAMNMIRNAHAQIVLINTAYEGQRALMQV